MKKRIEKLQGEIQDYADMFFAATEPHNGDSLVEIPLQARNEFANTLSHLVTIEELPTDEDVCNELEKAKRHIIRAVLDYYKYRLLKVHQQGLSSSLLHAMIKIRHHESTHIGSSHEETAKKYAKLLDQAVGVVSSKHGGDPLPKGHPEYWFFQEYKLFMQLEAVFSFIVAEKSTYFSLKAINIFCNSPNLVDAMSELNYELKRRIVMSILKVDLPLQKSVVREGYLVNDFFGTKEEVRERANKATDNVLKFILAKIGIELVPFKPSRIKADIVVDPYTGTRLN